MTHERSTMSQRSVVACLPKAVKTSPGSRSMALLSRRVESVTRLYPSGRCPSRVYLLRGASPGVRDASRDLAVMALKCFVEGVVPPTAPYSTHLAHNGARGSGALRANAL